MDASFAFACTTNVLAIARATIVRGSMFGVSTAKEGNIGIRLSSINPADFRLLFESLAKTLVAAPAATYETFVSEGNV